MTARLLSRRAALASLGLAAAGACARPRDARTLRVGYEVITFAKLYEAVARAFEAHHPGITVKLMPGTSYVGMMSRDFRLALVGDEPDVSHVSINAVRFYADRNLALPLDRRVNDEPTPLTTHRSIGKIGGETRALPFAISIPVNYFNNRLVERAGHDPRALLDAKWPALLKIATDISALGPPVSGMFYDIAGGAALMWQLLVLGYGGQIASADERRVAFGDDAGLRSARLLAAIRGTGQLDMSRENARMAFASGLLGSYTNTSSNMDRFSPRNMGFGVTMSPVPIDPHVGRRPAAGNAVVITTRQPARQETAWQYVRFVTGPIGQTIMGRLSGYLTLNRAALDDPAGLSPYVAANPQYRALYSLVDTLDQWYSFPGPRSEQIASSITTRMRAILIGRQTAEAALAAMVTEAQRLLDRR